LPLGLTSAVILGSESCGTHDHILLSQTRDSPNMEGQVPILYHQELGGPIITPGTAFPFRRLLRLAGLRWRYSTPPPHGVLIVAKSKLLYDWRFITNQFVLASVLFRLNTCGHSFYVTSSLTRRCVCLLWIRFLYCCVLIDCFRDLFTAQLRSNARGADPQRTPLATPLLLLRDITTYVTRSYAPCLWAIT
jgi:hypothetical protein